VENISLYTVAMALKSIWMIGISLVTASGSFLPSLSRTTKADPRSFERKKEKQKWR
jgi:hypothetical protein